MRLSRLQLRLGKFRIQNKNWYDFVLVFWIPLFSPWIKSVKTFPKPCPSPILVQELDCGFKIESVLLSKRILKCNRRSDGLEEVNVEPSGVTCGSLPDPGPIPVLQIDRFDVLDAKGWPLLADKLCDGEDGEFS